MLLLVVIAFVAGMVTAVSPCVLPVLPIIFAAGATGGPRRPYAVIAGLVLSFTVFTLSAAALLSALGLPDDLLRNIAIGIVLLVALSLVWPRLAHLLERPFYVLGRHRPSDTGSGFVLGLSLGLLFTPCAGPIIAAVATLAATRPLSFGTVAITFSYALGHGLVLLALSLGARRGFSSSAFRRRAPLVRRGLGVMMAAVAVLMIFGLDLRLARNVPGYTRALQGLEESAAAQEQIDNLLGANRSKVGAESLEDFGPAPEFANLSGWLNSRPLTIRELRGKVVLIDFWTYSCINCLRTLPYVKRWDEAYRDKGLVIVGVHTPEFAFERVRSNVEKAVESLGVEYPVALDNDYGTWNAWSNRYWPAKYFIDRKGHLRYAHFGEGEYEESEHVIRTLLAEPGLPEPVAASVAADTPGGVETPETYLGYGRIDRFVGSAIRPDEETDYTFPLALPLNGLAYEGRWTVERERIVAGQNARLRLRFHARKVHLVLGTEAGATGTVEVRVDGKRLPSVHVTGDRLYTLAELPGDARDHLLELRLSPGAEAYAFTFG